MSHEMMTLVPSEYALEGTSERGIVFKGGDRWATVRIWTHGASINFAGDTIVEVSLKFQSPTIDLTPFSPKQGAPRIHSTRTDFRRNCVE
jgi:hypothetical protein